MKKPGMLQNIEQWLRVTGWVFVAWIVLLLAIVAAGMAAVLAFGLPPGW